MTILNKIIQNKRNELLNIQDIKKIENDKFSPRSLSESLKNKGISVIAEIKMKSPSEGDIFKNCDYIQIAKEYESAGASAISVLTDNKFFGGNIKILQEVRNSVKIPVLRKDFIIDNCQIIETLNFEGDSFLLIAEALAPNQLESLYNYGKSLGLETLIELHEMKNIDLVNQLKPEIVGVNCRDLSNMTIDLQNFKTMIDFLPNDSLKIAESGIKNNTDLKYITDLGYDGVLVGSSLMKTKKPGKALENLLRGVK